MEQYRGMVEWSARGVINPAPLVRDHTRRMQQAAAELRFEVAGKIKALVDQLGRLGKGPYRHVAMLRDFQFLSFQHGPREGTAKVFLVTPGGVEEILGIMADDFRPAEVMRAALEHAAALASALGGGLIAVHVRADALTPHATSLMPGPQPFSGSGDAAGSPLGALEHSLAHLDLNIPVSTRIEVGYAAERLAAVAMEQPSAILVVGSRGQGAVAATLLGSVSRSVLRDAKRPVVVVRTGAHVRPATASAISRNSVQRRR
jgi:nucleotide-binding universal stress UspA family protein